MVTMSKYSNAVVICTRNRPNQVSALIEGLVNQSLQPDLVVVVDASDDALVWSDTRTSFDTPGVDAWPFSIELIRAQPGLPRQRNIALVAIEERAELVHFFDDDVELEPDYLLEIYKAFSTNPMLVGASGDVVNAHPVEPNIAQILFLLKSRRGGTVLASGVNIGMPGQKPTKKVMWLPGCAMSYRLSAIDGFRFDESRLGYALGEDVDFSARMGLVGRLDFIGNAKLRHNFAQSNRLDVEELAHDDVVSRWKLASELPFVNKLAVAYATVGHAFLYYVTSPRRGCAWQRRAAKTRLKTLWSLLGSAS